MATAIKLGSRTRPTLAWLKHRRNWFTANEEPASVPRLLEDGTTRKTEDGVTRMTEGD